MIEQTQLPVVSPANEILGVISITATQFVGDETTFSVTVPGSAPVVTLQYPIRKVDVLRPDSVRQEYMALAFTLDDIRKEYHRHVPGFAEVSTLMDNTGWTFATRQHIEPHRYPSALEKMLARATY